MKCQYSLWNICISSLVILAALVYETSCGKTDKTNGGKNWIPTIAIDVGNNDHWTVDQRLLTSPLDYLATTNLSLERVCDERQMHWVDGLNTLLHHVIAVLILHAFQHVTIQLLRNLHLTCALNISPTEWQQWHHRQKVYQVGKTSLNRHSC